MLLLQTQGARPSDEERYFVAASVVWYVQALSFGSTGVDIDFHFISFAYGWHLTRCWHLCTTFVFVFVVACVRVEFQIEKAGRNRGHYQQHNKSHGLHQAKQYYGPLLGYTFNNRRCPPMEFSISQLQLAWVLVRSWHEMLCSWNFLLFGPTGGRGLGNAQARDFGNGAFVY